MTNKDILQQAATCPIDDIVVMINDMKAKIKLLEEVKRARIKDGEKTADMIKREQKKQQKTKQRSVQQVGQQVVPPINQGQVTQ